MAFDPLGNRFAVSPGGNGVQVWGLDPLGRPHSGRQLIPEGEEGKLVGGVAFSPDGSRVATAGQDGAVRLWDAVDGHSVGEPYTHQRAANAAAFSPDGTLLASASDDGTVAVSNISNSKNTILTGHLSTVEAVAFSPNGRMLASASSDGTVQLWDTTASFRNLGPLSGNARAIVDVAFSPDGATLAGATSDGTVLLWDVASREAPETLTSGVGASAVTFSPDGKFLAVADPTGMPVVWDVEPKRVADRICELQPSLTRSEWSRYVPGEPYQNVCR
jgi:WD40 repeat protein